MPQNSSPLSQPVEPDARPLWHTLSKDRVLVELETTRRGLTPEEAAHRQSLFGPNTIPTKAPDSAIFVFLRQFGNPFVLTLIAIAAVVLFLGKFLDTVVIVGITIVNSIIGFIHETRAARAIQALQGMLTPKARIRRAGKMQELPIGEIVPGDILLVAPGDLVPADARLIAAKLLAVNESLLTGEPLPERKEAKELPKNHLPLPDRKNMLYAGTLVEAGSGEAVIVATGGQSELGRIAEAVREAPEPPSLFEQRLRYLGQLLVIVIGVVALFFFLIGVVKHESPVTMFLAAAAMAVSLIPEGLPMVVTLAMAAGVTRMARRRAIIRRLGAVEILGTVTTVCTDKTGTLTENEMTVREIVTPNEHFSVTGVGFSPHGSFQRQGKEIDAEEYPDLMHVLTAGTLVNDSELSPVVGDHTEVALLGAAAKAGLAKSSLVANRPRLDVLPFDSSLGFMASLHREENGHAIYVKGAPEKVLTLTSLTPTDRARFLAETDEFAKRAFRVLALGVKYIAKDTTLSVDEVKDVTFLGLMALEDPPREEAKSAVQEAMEAGVRVIMLTGDNLHTAQAVAHRVGIPAGGNQCTDGEILEGVGSDELRHLVSQVNVFARVSPLQKLRIVKALKARGEIVAVTGDGINDAPALAQADIGIAMGEEGTDVAREAAKMVLSDDNFASIVAAIEEGRTIYNNIQRVLLYLLSTSLGEALTIVVGFAAGLPLVVLPLQILWINFVTDGFAGFPLALEPVKERVMAHPPLDPKGSILSREMIIRILIVGLVMAIGGLWLFRGFLPQGVEVARTVTFVFLVVVQLFNILNVRSKYDSVLAMNLTKNRSLLPALFLAFSLMLAVVYVPGLARIFQLVPLSWSELLLPTILASVVILAIEARKLIWNRRNPAHTHPIEA